MWVMLAGVPGKLKALTDRLTAARAANLDNLDATVSSRAPANTALSNAVWTPARAGKLDEIQTPILSRPTRPGGWSGNYGVDGGSVVSTSQDYQGAGSYDVLDLEGPGVINLASVTMYQGTTISRSGSFKLWFYIDGELIVSTGLISRSFGQGERLNWRLVGQENIGFYDNLPFLQTAKVTVEIVNDASGFLQASCRSLYRLV